MIVWSQSGPKHHARSSMHGGDFASVYEDAGQVVIEFYVGPKGKHRAPSIAKGKAWVERFARSREEALSRAAIGSAVPSAAVGYITPAVDAETQARYDAFHASYVPKSRTRKGRRKPF